MNSSSGPSDRLDQSNAILSNFEYTCTSCNTSNDWVNIQCENILCCKARPTEMLLSKQTLIEYIQKQNNDDAILRVNSEALQSLFSRKKTLDSNTNMDINNDDRNGLTTSSLHSPSLSSTAVSFASQPSLTIHRAVTKVHDLKDDNGNAMLDDINDKDMNDLFLLDTPTPTNIYTAVENKLQHDNEDNHNINSTTTSTTSANNQDCQNEIDLTKEIPFNKDGFKICIDSSDDEVLNTDLSVLGLERPSNESSFHHLTQTKMNHEPNVQEGIITDTSTTTTAAATHNNDNHEYENESKIEKELKKIEDHLLAGLDCVNHNNRNHKHNRGEAMSVLVCIHCNSEIQGNEMNCTICERNDQRRRNNRRNFEIVTVNWSHLNHPHQISFNRPMYFIKAPVKKSLYDLAIKIAKRVIEEAAMYVDKGGKEEQKQQQQQQQTMILSNIIQVTDTYFKSHLDATFVNDNVDIFNQFIPPGISLRDKNRSQNSTIIAFYNKCEGICDTHYDRDSSILLLLRGSKSVMLAPNSIIKKFQLNVKTNSTILEDFNPFELKVSDGEISQQWKVVELQAGDCLLIPKDVVHSVKSSRNAIALSFQIERDYNPRKQDLEAKVMDVLKKLTPKKKKRKGYDGDRKNASSPIQPNPKRTLTRGSTAGTFTLHLRKRSDENVKRENLSSSIQANSRTFTLQLMELLNKEDPSIISYLPNSDAFEIRDGNRLLVEVLPKYFSMTKLDSFKSQLNKYGFHRIKTGPHSIAYEHELFKRDQPELCQLMHNKKNKNKNMKYSIPDCSKITSKNRSAIKKEPLIYDNQNNSSLCRKRFRNQKDVHQKRVKSEESTAIINTAAWQFEEQVNHWHTPPSSHHNIISSRRSQRKKRFCGICGHWAFMTSLVESEMWIMMNLKDNFIPSTFPKHLICVNCGPKNVGSNFFPDEAYKKENDGTVIPYVTKEECPCRDKFIYCRGARVDYEVWAENRGKGNLHGTFEDEEAKDVLDGITTAMI